MANGKIKEVQTVNGHYIITFEQENTFVTHDLIRCKTFTGGSQNYWVETANVNGDTVVIPVSEFAGAVPMPGDECVLMGNTADSKRQNLILISATEDGQPRIDVLDGVHEKNFTGCLRTRLGNLDGITDDWFPADNQPHGNGLYADNAYLRGTFLLVTGEDIKTKFEIVEGRIKSSIEAIRHEIAVNGNYLNNPAFVDGMDHWTASNDATFFSAGGNLIWTGTGHLENIYKGVNLIDDNGRKVLRVTDSSVIQKLSDLRSKPTFKSNGDGKREAVPVYLSFFYKVKTAGVLKVVFENVDKTGFENFNSFECSTDLNPTDGYLQFTSDGLWNGTGDFRLSFTGEIYICMLLLSTDKTEALTYKYRTLFEQSEKLIKIAAQNFDKNGNILEQSSIITNAKYNRLISERFDENGNLINTAGLVTTADFATLFAQGVKDNKLVTEAKIEVFVTEDDVKGLISQIKLKADQIDLNGLITANGNFKINEDGSIEAIKGTIGGFTITANSICANGGYSGGNYAGVDAGTSKFFLHSSGNGFLGFSDKYKWVGMGLDTSAGAFLGGCLLRVQNTTPSEVYDNYAVYINVSGGRNNIGLFMYGDLRVNARGYHVLNGHTYLNSDKGLRVALDMSEDGSFTQYYEGVTFGFNDYDLDKVRIQVQNGLIVGVKHE